MKRGRVNEVGRERRSRGSVILMCGVLYCDLMTNTSTTRVRIKGWKVQTTKHVFKFKSILRATVKTYLSD